MATPAAFGDKSLITSLAADAYLSYAAIAPASARVQGAVNEVLADYGERGQGALLKWLEQRERLRGKLARLLGVESRSIAFSTSTTRALGDLAMCLPWQSDDRVLLAEGEFPANVTPWQNAARLFSLELHFLPKLDPERDDARFLDALEGELRKGRVRLVALSAVQFQTGARTPLAEVAPLCARYGAELAVDAIQAAGIVPLDVRALGIDYVAGGAHKWLMGLEGTAYLYAKPERAAALIPRSAGWLSHEDGLRFLLEGPGALRYDRPIKREIQFLEGSSASALGFAALEAGLDPILELGPSAIFEHVNAYLDELEQTLLARGLRSLRAKERERRSGILSFMPPPGFDAGQIVGGLRAERIMATTPDGLVRFAPHFPNSRDELPRIASALARVLG